MYTRLFVCVCVCVFFLKGGHVNPMHQPPPLATALQAVIYKLHMPGCCRNVATKKREIHGGYCEVIAFVIQLHRKSSSVVNFEMKIKL